MEIKKGAKGKASLVSEVRNWKEEMEEMKNSFCDGKLTLNEIRKKSGLGELQDEKANQLFKKV